MSGNNSNTISYERALELARYSRNDETVVPSFHLRLSEFGTPEGVKFVGEILRTNKLIEWFDVDFRGKVLPAKCFEGVLHFISNNPSLRFLRVDCLYFEVSEALQIADLGLLILRAASTNKHIEKITIGSNIVQYLASSSQEKLKLSPALKELELKGISEGLVNLWPEIHSLRTLRLKNPDYQDEGDNYPKNLSALLGKLKDSGSSRKIQCLELAGWSPIIPTYLFSPNCALVTLHLDDLNFNHKGDELYSAMDGLLWGLAGSKGTTDLILQDCTFDSLAKRKMLQGLQSGVIGIRRLDCRAIVSNNRLTGQDMVDLLTCNQLDSLGLEHSTEDWNVQEIDRNADNINRGIERCSLNTLKLSTDCPGSFIAGLTTACTNNVLTNLTLTNCDFSVKDLKCLISLIEEERSQLRKLTISEYFDNNGDLYFPSSIFKALQGKSKLETLRIESNKADEILLGLKESLGELKSLITLEIFLARKLSSDEEKNISSAMSTNWILENMQLGGIASALLFDDNRQGEPIVSHALKTKLERFARRNKFKKAILESPVALSPEEIKGWLNKLGSVWELPDGLTLAFELLQFRPGCFF